MRATCEKANESLWQQWAKHGGLTARLTHVYIFRLDVNAKMREQPILFSVRNLPWLTTNRAGGARRNTAKSSLAKFVAKLWLFNASLSKNRSDCSHWHNVPMQHFRSVANLPSHRVNISIVPGFSEHVMDLLIHTMHSSPAMLPSCPRRQEERARSRHRHHLPHFKH